MGTSYAVTWQEADSSTRSGRLDFGPSGFVLDGANGCGPVRLHVPYDEIGNVRLVRTASERLNGRPTLVVDRRGDGELRIAGAVILGGIAAELAERLASGAPVASRAR